MDELILVNGMKFVAFLPEGYDSIFAILEDEIVVTNGQDLKWIKREDGL